MSTEPITPVTPVAPVKPGWSVRITQLWTVDMEPHILGWLDEHCIASWRVKITQLWTIRVALFWIILSAIATIWSALTEVMPLWVYAVLGILMNVTLGIARIAKQPGVDE